MQRTRTFEIPTTVPLAAGLAVLLVLMLINITASGVVRGGGDDDNGSGIGGTGRMLVPGSGIGGTGVKPFLGINSTQDVQILFDSTLRDAAVTQALPLEVIPSRPLLIEPVPGIARVMRPAELTRDSSPLDISEVIQTSLDIDVLYFEQLDQQLVELGSSNELEDALRESSMSEPGLEAEKLSWDQLARLVGSTREPTDPARLTSLADAGMTPQDSARLHRPERVQRPELPPLQRVSPMQRTAILPPRVQPLRL